MNEHQTQDSQSFARWATELWAKYAQAGNRFIQPSRADHSAMRGFMGETIDYYAALYPRDEFQSLSEFWLYKEYIDPIHYQILEGSDLEWETMVREISDWSMERLQEKFQKDFNGQDEIKGSFTRKHWKLPQNSPWLLDLDIIQGRITEGSDTLECLAETEQGFLTVFALID